MGPLHLPAKYAILVSIILTFVEPCWSTELRCSALFSTDAQSEAGRMIWSKIENPINELIGKNVLEQVSNWVPEPGRFNYNGSGGSKWHVETLKTHFGLSTTPGKERAITVREAFKSYRQAINSRMSGRNSDRNDSLWSGFGFRAKETLNPNDVLWPKFIFRTKENELIGLEPGEQVPDGATLVNHVLKQDDFHRLLAQGIFPVGGHALTPTGISAFEHDLAHLTAFIESPTYMRLWKQSQLRTDRKAPTADWSYFLGEALFVIRPDTKTQLLESMGWPKQFERAKRAVTIENVEAWLQAQSPEANYKVAKLLKTNINSFVHTLGGAGRDFMSEGPHHNIYRQFSGEYHLNPDASTVSSLHALAKLQVFLYYAKDISIKDWFVTPEDGDTPAKQKLHALFVTSGLWPYTKNTIHEPSYMGDVYRTYFDFNE